MTIELADQSKIEKVYDEALELLLTVFGIDCALLTDESAMCDFSPDEEDLAHMSKLVGRQVSRSTYIWEVAEEYARRTGLE